MRGRGRQARFHRSLIQSFVYAWRGLKWVAATQRNMKIHLAISAAVLVAAAWFKVTPGELALLFFAMALVMVAEMLNSAVEKAVDLVTAEHHPLAGMAKDAAAGAVMLAAFFSVLIGLLIFYPYVKNWFMDMLIQGR